jgi:hypothetical protein
VGGGGAHGEPRILNQQIQGTPVYGVKGINTLLFTILNVVLDFPVMTL